MKRVLCCILVLCMCAIWIPVNANAVTWANSNTEPANYKVAVSSCEELSSRLNILMNKYNGTSWTSTGKPCSGHDSSDTCYSKYYYGRQCSGFAKYIFNDLFCGGSIGSTSPGDYALYNLGNAVLVGQRISIGSKDGASVKSLLSQAKPGDFIQAHRRDENYGHSMIIVGVSDSGIEIFDCNSGTSRCTVRVYNQDWNTFASKNDSFSLYRSTRYPENGDAGVSPETCTCSESYAGNYTCTTSSQNLNIRSGHGSSYGVVDSIPSGATVYVSKASGTGSTDWGHVEYNGVSGYASMEYLAKQGHNPQGVLDSLSGGTHAINIGGWAFDRDDMNTPLEIHVYVGDQGHAYRIEANLERQDVNKEYGCGNYHGFAATINVDSSLIGNQKVDVYAYNIGGGANVLLGSGTVNISADTEPPTISDVQVYDITSTGYTVACSVRDNTGINVVQFPTWTEPEQDEITWGEGTHVGNNENGAIFIARVDIGRHNNERNNYTTHIWAWDNYGNASSVSIPEHVTVWPEKPADLGTKFTALIFNEEAWMPIENKYEITGDTMVKLAKQDAGAYQLWYFDRQDDGSYIISSCYDGRNLDVLDASTEWGAKVQTHINNGHDAQRWFIYEYKDGYVMRTKLSDCVLEIPGNNTTIGTGVQVYTCNGSDAQIWSIYQGNECKLGTPQLSVSVDSHGKNAKFDWARVYGAKAYNIRIMKSGSAGFEEYCNVPNVSPGYSVDLPNGTYQAYIEATHYYGVKQSNVVTLNVLEEDREPPVISNVHVHNLTSKGYFISCTVTDNVSVKNVQFSSGSQDYYEDDAESTIVDSSNGYYLYQFIADEATIEDMRYITYITAEDSNGNSTKYLIDPVTLPKDYPVENTNIILAYLETDDGVKIVSSNNCDKSASGDLVIPFEIDGKPVVSIGNDVFYDCDGLISVVVHEGVKRIGSLAFRNCDNLETVTLPSTLEKIGNIAFGECAKLSNVIYGGTPEQWENIEIGSENEYLLAASITYTHLHTLEFVPASDPTCEDDGYTAHYRCKTCDEWMEDTAGKSIILDKNTVIIPALDHSFEEGLCTRCGEEAELVSIQIQTMPNKTVYEIGDLLDVAGLSLKLNYLEGSSKTITAGYEISGFDSSAPGEKVVTVTYQGKTAEFTVTVNEAVAPEDQIVLEFSEGRGVVGSVVQLKLYISNLPEDGISSLDLSLKYDPAQLKLTSVPEDGGILGEHMFGNNIALVPYGLTWNNLENIAAEGILLTLEFEILQMPEDGVIKIQVTGNECADLDENIYAIADAEGVITKGLPGDVNGDGKITQIDVTRIRKYLAGGWDVEIDEAAADVNGDGKITQIDVTRLRKYLAGGWDVILG